MMNDNGEKLLSSIGLCVRAGKAIVGVPMICEALKKGGRNAPLLVIEASDTSENTHKKITDKCKFYGVRHVRINILGECLAHALGKSGVSGAVAITDVGMCAMLEKYI